MTITIEEFIRVYSPICQPAQDWLRASGLMTMSEAWEVCPRGDWMWKVALPDREMSMQFAQWCAQRANASTYAAAFAYYAAHADACSATAALAFAAAALAFAATAVYYAADAAAELQAQADWIRSHIANPFD